MNPLFVVAIGLRNKLLCPIRHVFSTVSMLYHSINLTLQSWKLIEVILFQQQETLVMFMIFPMVRCFNGAPL